MVKALPALLLKTSDSNKFIKNYQIETDYFITTHGIQSDAARLDEYRKKHQDKVTKTNKDLILETVNQFSYLREKAFNFAFVIIPLKFYLNTMRSKYNFFSLAMQLQWIVQAKAVLKDSNKTREERCIFLYEMMRAFSSNITKDYINKEKGKISQLQVHLNKKFDELRQLPEQFVDNNRLALDIQDFRIKFVSESKRSFLEKEHLVLEYSIQCIELMIDNAKRFLLMLDERLLEAKNKNVQEKEAIQENCRPSTAVHLSSDH